MPMRKILYLTKYELRQIKKSALLTAIVLSIFLAALFGVVSVQSDLMNNMCAHLDERYGSLSFSAKGAFSDVTRFGEQLLVDDHWAGLNIQPLVTRCGNVYDMAYGWDDDGNFLFGRRGTTVIVNQILYNTLAFCNDALIDGKWVSSPFEICLSEELAQEVDAKLGEQITIDGLQFTYVGVYNEETIRESTDWAIYGKHIISVDGSIVVNLDLTYSSSLEMFEVYRSLKREGVEVSLGWHYEGYYTDITQVRAVFTAVDVVLAIVIVIALYSLVSLLFRQRKTQICRLKILGASDRIVAFVYCGTVIILMFAVVLVATALGIAFNLYFMDLCEQLLQYTFLSHFNFFAPVISFGLFVAVTFALWTIVNAKTASLATEVRYE